MTTNQTSALTEAQAQPSASSRPNRARRRGRVIPAGRAWLGHRPPSSPATRRPSAVPVMFGCTVQTNVYVPAASGGHLVGARGDAREDVALEHRAPVPSLISTLCGTAGVLVVERDGEGGPGRGRQAGRGEGDARGGRWSRWRRRRPRARPRRRPGPTGRPSRRRAGRGGGGAGERVGPAGRERRGAGVGLVVRVAPAGERLDLAGRRVDLGRPELGVADDVRLRRSVARRNAISSSIWR